MYKSLLLALASRPLEEVHVKIRIESILEELPCNISFAENGSFHLHTSIGTNPSC